MINKNESNNGQAQSLALAQRMKGKKRVRFKLW